MYHIIKLCSLCLCYNKKLAKIIDVDEKSVNFLNKILCSAPNTKMKTNKKYICEICSSKLESFNMFSELCLKYKNYTTFCCVCLSDDRKKIMNLRKLSTDCTTFYFKLIKSVRPQTFICDKCYLKMKYYLKFYEQCIKSATMFTNYIDALSIYTNNSYFSNYKLSIELEKIELQKDEHIIFKEHHIIHEKEQIIVKDEKQMNYEEERQVIFKVENQISSDEEQQIILNDGNHMNYEGQQIIFKEEPIDEMTIKKEIVYPELDIVDNLVYTNDNLNNYQEILYDCKQPNVNISNLLETEQNINESLTIDSNESSNEKAEIISQKEYKSSKIFQCLYCPNNTETQTYKQHRLLHTNKDQIQCLICLKICQTMQGLLSHVDSHFLFRKNIQNVNPKSIVLKSSQDKYKVVTKSIKTKAVSLPKFECQYCPKNTKICSFRKHKFHHMDRLKNQCRICSKVYLRYKGLYCHIKTHFAYYLSKIKNDNKNRSIKTKKQTISSNLECPYCPQSTIMEGFQEHALTHLNKDLNQCLICLNIYTNNEDLYKHYITHFDQRETINPEIDIEDNSAYTNIDLNDFVEILYDYEQPNVSLSVLQETVNNTNNDDTIPVFANKQSDENTVMIRNENISSENFKCSYCPNNSEMQPYKQHRLLHTDKNRNQCLICLKICQTMQGLLSHIDSHFLFRNKMNNIKPESKVLSSSSDKMEEATMSMKKKTVLVPKFECQYCPKNTKICSFRKHKFHHMDRLKNQCRICSKVYVKYKGLYSHIKTHFTNYLSKINNNNKNRSTKIKKRTISSNLECPYCPERTIMKNFREHAVFHLNKDKNQCLICSKIFLNYKNFYMHYITHFDNRRIYNPKRIKQNFVCQYCPKTSIVQNFHEHKFSHMNTQNNQCLICFKKYKLYRNLYEHLKNHFKIFKSGPEKPLKVMKNCNSCDKQFKWQSTYLLHMSTHVKNEERPYKCTVCNIGFKTRSTLKNHNDVKHENKIFYCEVCHFSFKSKRYLDRHTHTKNHKYNMQNLSRN